MCKRKSPATPKTMSIKNEAKIPTRNALFLSEGDISEVSETKIGIFPKTSTTTKREIKDLIKE
jgi:hypothetical protein